MNLNRLLRGSIPAIVTPMHENGQFDLESFKALLDWHVAEGSKGVVIGGTTGEAPTLSIKEQISLVQFGCDYLQGRLPVIAGTGANSTQEAIELTTLAQKAGAVAHLSVVPYYNKPTQQGIKAHFQAITDACELPMVIYNVPGRTVADIHNDTLLALAEVPQVIGVKDATGHMGRGFDLICRRPPGFLVLSGDDETALALTLLGGDGVISVTANAYPKLMATMIEDALQGRIPSALKQNAVLQELHRMLFVETSPAPLKWIMAHQGRLKNNLRLPLVPLSKKHEKALGALIGKIG